MNGQEKSDPAIVAGRPTNESQRCASEPAEPRAGTEGNAGQQSTRRAQDWISVSQALERIRQAARRNKKEKFTALLHRISVELLETAFFENGYPLHTRSTAGRGELQPMIDLYGAPGRWQLPVGPVCTGHSRDRRHRCGTLGPFRERSGDNRLREWDEQRFPPSDGSAECGGCGVAGVKGIPIFSFYTSAPDARRSGRPPTVRP